MPEPQHLNPQSAQPTHAGLQTANMSGGGASNVLAPPAFQLKASPVQMQTAGGEVTEEFTPKQGDKVTTGKSVGMGGDNDARDVKVVQFYLVQKGYLPATLEDGTSRINGDCDDDTIFAIRQIQTQVVEASNLDARVDAGGSIEKALLGEITKQRKDLTATEGMIGQIEQNFPNGINVALWANYDNQSSNNKEFKNAADKYAPAFNSIGFDSSGALKIGMAVPIKSEADVINAINDIHNLLVAEYEKAKSMCIAQPPAFTKIKTLALFAHGLPKGMAMSKGGDYNMSIGTDKETKEFEMFVKAIKGPLKNDVDVNLMACNSGRETDGTEPGKEGVWYLSTAEKNNGDTSFGAKFAEELGSEASVYAHLSRGHTVNNYSARVFGADAGKDATQDKGGVHIFRLLYPDTFMTSEATRLEKDKDKVDDHMWKHFKKRMKQSHDGEFSVPQGDGTDRKVNQLGADMFSDLEGTSTMLQEDWKSWVKDNPVP
jgi:hypothetical protein